jgi:dienelactone hydrolase
MQGTPALLRSLVIAVLLAASACDGGDGGRATVDLATLAAPGPYAVGTRDLALVDASRETPSNGSFAGSPERRLPTLVWYPVDATAAGDPGADAVSTDGPFPLIGYAHGYSSSRDEGRVLGAHLASHGYVAVAVTFPLSNGSAPGGPTIGDMTSQPGDLAFAMAAVTDGAAGEDVAAAIDPSRRGIAGLSLGGGTVLIGGYHPKWRIEDVDAAVALAPASCFFGPDLYARSLPLLVLAGDGDMLVPLESGPAHAFDIAPPPITLATLAGGNHVGFIGIDAGGDRNTDAIVGCPVIGTGGSIAGAGYAALAAKLAEGAGPNAADPNGCTGGICEEELPQTMSAERQLEITRAAALAHFEAILRGRPEARSWLEGTLAATNPDVSVAVK